MKGIRGNWNNREKGNHNKNLGEVNNRTAEGMPLEEAVKEAWTYKMAKSKGFTSIRVVSYEGTPGQYSKIVVEITE